MAEPLRVLLVDDHALIRAGVRAQLERVPQRITVVGEAEDVPGAIAAVHALKPDVVLLDVHLPGGSGSGGAQVVRDCADITATRFLALSVSDAADDVVSVIRAGARGYVTKAIAPSDEVMRLIARGYTYKEVASELFISIKTVETHVSKVLRKLQLSNRYELTRWANARNLV